jgi:Family of unknown function (DUF6502)
MPEQQIGRAPRVARITRHGKRILREVSVDDVIKQLLDLFDHLGVDAGRLASRVTDLKSKAIVSKRLYPHIAAIGELLTSWHQDSDFLDDSGHPLPIKMRGARRSFYFLAEKSVPKMKPNHLLAELEKIGAVAIDADRLVRVRMRSLPVYEDRRLAIQHTLTSLDSFIRTLRHNLNSARSNSDQLFHRVARNGAFDIREIPALKIRVKRQAQSFLESSDNWMARRLTDKSKNSKSKIAHVAIGVYLSVDRE